MRRRFRSQSFVMADGERYCLLVDPDSGIPLFYPNLFLMTQVRNRSQSVAVMDAASAAINVALTYCAKCGIDLEKRFRSRRFFSPGELDAIRDECQKRFDKRGASTVVRFSQSPKERRVGRGSEYTRLTHIANYLQWFASTLLGTAIDDATSRHIVQMHRGLLGRRPAGRHSTSTKKAPTQEQLRVLQDVVDPASATSLFQSDGVRARNARREDAVETSVRVLELPLKIDDLVNVRIFSAG